ncbi:alpha-galactosidase [Pleomorphochaeta sp. DL1XJH-081]|uniref:alpha-galactosidase n=1 Tax=Pleomorphochaeta sp. DL1XJH-081 TaxID=3409690 RepID=UPI003BB59269
MIHEKNLVFTLHTAWTTYIFRVNETNHLEQLYYGRRIGTTDHMEPLYDKHTISVGNSVSYDEEHPSLTLDNICLEYSSYGKGDFREPPILFSRQNGDRIADFHYKEHRIIKGKPRSFSGLPESYGDKNQCMTLIVVLKERVSALRLELSYTTFDQANVIVRKASLTNDMGETIILQRFSSLQLDLPTSDYSLVTFDGAWARERYRTAQRLRSGIHVNDSKTGVSSSRHNPCLFLTTNEDNDNQGDCYGCNLIYSGDHAQHIETTPYGKVRLLTGLNPATFSWQLHPGEKFHTPEAILTFSHEGLNGTSRNFHRFINSHIVRGSWKYHQRPIVVNNWEATYFNFSEHALLKLARKAADLGAELFVLDDGWFGSREDDTTSLGDWTVNTKKLPDGLASLSKKIHGMGLLFGLWCEPEMVSRKSQLYREHPEWLVSVPGRNPSPGRNQYLLDLTREDVRDYLFESLSNIWKLANVDYVKWDMNRMFSDMYSNSEKFQQEEFNHRYMLGLYSLLQRFVEAFPQLLFESCASGGNRFDLGMLCYMPQTWTSDNTDALSRVYIQEGTSYGYPLSSMGAHVSESPNHQTLRVSNLESRFNVAAFGLLGYEMDLSQLSTQENEVIRNQIAFYKVHRSLLQYGEFFRFKTIADNNQAIWVVSAPDRTEMLALFFQTLNIPNPPTDILRIPIADPDLTYAVTPRRERIDLKSFGTLVNMVSPIRIKNDGNLQRLVDETVHLENELEYYIVNGDVLAYRGIVLNQQFGGTGYDKETRVLGDFGSRIYHLKALKG